MVNTGRAHLLFADFLQSSVEVPGLNLRKVQLHRCKSPAIGREIDGLDGLREEVFSDGLCSVVWRIIKNKHGVSPPVVVLLRQPSHQLGQVHYEYFSSRIHL